jgi:hypothetical protein
VWNSIFQATSALGDLGYAHLYKELAASFILKGPVLLRRSYLFAISFVLFQISLHSKDQFDGYSNECSRCRSTDEDGYFHEGLQSLHFSNQPALQILAN